MKQLNIMMCCFAVFGPRFGVDFWRGGSIELAPVDLHGKYFDRQLLPKENICTISTTLQTGMQLYTIHTIFPVKN